MKVLFVCFQNQNRSQIAEAMFNKFSKKNSAISAGIAPIKEGIMLKNSYQDMYCYPPILPMKEIGYDLSKARVKKLTKNRAASVDKIVFLFNIKKHWKEIPAYAKNSKGVEYWNISGIREGIDFGEYCTLERKRIKVIEKRVKGLVKRVG